jgi:hypothetical protein
MLLDEMEEPDALQKGVTLLLKKRDNGNVIRAWVAGWLGWR